MSNKPFPDKIKDPRPELPGSEEWVDLLKAAKEWGLENSDHHLYGHLVFFRLMGAKLVEHEKHGYKIEPIPDEWPEGSRGYEVNREQHLKPYKKVVAALLKEISKEEGVKA